MIRRAPRSVRGDASEPVMRNPVQYRFRLFVAGSALNSVQALANLTALCRTWLPEHHNIEVVDVLQDPKRALAESIFMTPTLIKLAPLPTVTIVGNLGQTTLVLQALGLDAVTP